MNSTTNVLITGANRGIGKGFVAAYLLRPDHVVIATVRDPTHDTSKSLSALPTAKGSSLIILLLDNGSETSINNAVETLKSRYSVSTLDIVIPNAGMAEFYGSALKTPIQAVRDHYNVNTVATLALFQATYPLLSAAAEKGASTPKFVPISTTVGSIGDMEKWPMNATAYGASKAALNWITKNIHIENQGIIAFPMHPGWVQTDMGNAGALANGLTEAPVTLKESIDGMISKIDNATRESTSGKFVSFDGEHINW